MLQKVRLLGHRIKVRINVAHAAGLTRIGKFDPNDVFIVGYPKSGNTWFQYLVSEIVYGVNATIAPDSLINQIVVDVDYKAYYFRLGKPMFFKSHQLPMPEHRRVVYLLRDGRDAMVSYFHHIKAIEHLKELDYMDVVRNGTYLSPCKWHEHVEQWLANPYDAQIMTIKYEEMKAQPLETLEKFCAYMGLERDKAYLEQVVQRTSLSEMKKRDKMGWDTKAWPKDQPFIRRGSVGSFKDEMPEDVLKEFLSQAGNTLCKVGYAID